MAEVLVEFDTVMTAADGSRWVPRACGRVADEGGLWEGWIEYLPVDTSREPMRSGRETEQPNRDDLLYWAQGLTQVYLEGALRRAIDASSPRPPRVASEPVRPHFDRPAPHVPRAPRAAQRPAPSAVLDPFAVYRQGRDILLRQLSALDASRLREIVRAYGLGDGGGGGGGTDAAGKPELTALILEAVRRQEG